MGRSRRIPVVEWEALDVLVDVQVLICIVVLHGDVDVYQVSCLYQFFG